jgi:hypothetical protein
MVGLRSSIILIFYQEKTLNSNNRYVSFIIYILSTAYHKKAFTATSSKLTDYIVAANRGKAHSVLKGSNYPPTSGGGTPFNQSAGGYSGGSSSIIV